MLWSMVTDNVDMKLDHFRHMVLDGDDHELWSDFTLQNYKKL